MFEKLKKRFIKKTSIQNEESIILRLILNFVIADSFLEIFLDAPETYYFLLFYIVTSIFFYVINNNRPKSN